MDYNAIVRLQIPTNRDSAGQEIYDSLVDVIKELEKTFPHLRLLELSVRPAGPAFEHIPHGSIVSTHTGISQNTSANAGSVTND